MNKQAVLERVARKWRDFDSMTIDERAASFLYVHEILDAGDYIKLLTERDQLCAANAAMRKALEKAHFWYEEWLVDGGTETVSIGAEIVSNCIIKALSNSIAQREAERVGAMEKLLRDIVNDLERPEQGELPPWKLDLLQRSKAVLGGGE